MDDSSDPLMGWQSYIVPFLGSALVSTVTYFLGKYNYSFIWIVLIIVISVVKSYLWRKRERRLLSLRATATREREVILAQLQDLPAWVQFPDTERVEWINKVVLQLWPYVGEYAKVFMNDFIIPQVKQQMPAMFKNFKFTKMDMGDIPCRVGGIKVYTTNVGRDRIIVDMDVAYAGDADFTVSCCGFTGGMNNIQFSGKLRAILKPLLPFPPMVGGISATFLEMPKMDFNLTGMGEMVELPGLMDAIRSVINSQIGALCVLPNEVVVPLAPDVDVTKLYFPEPDGVVRLKIIEARNLENRDISFITKGKSDPYCEIQVGSQFLKTRTIDNDLNPIWNEYFEAVVDQADGQKLRIELFDEDQGRDEELGRLSLDLSMIQAKGSVNKWYPLEGCKHGDLHLKATWMELSSDVKHLEQQEWEAEWAAGDKPIHSALLMVFVDSVSDLPYPKSKLEPSPFIEVTLGGETQRTPVKVKTVNPLFQSKFMFFVRNVEGQELKFEAIDDGTRRSLGSFTLTLDSLLNEPNLEKNQEMEMLTLGVHQSPMVITTRLRILKESSGNALKMNELKEKHKEMLAKNLAVVQAGSKQKSPEDLNHMLLEEYGNAQYIERARKDDVVAAEPAKTVANGVNDADVEVKLNVANYQMIRSESNPSLDSTSRPNSRFGRLFKSKHEMKKKDRSYGDENRGEIELQIDYDEMKNQLVVTIVKCKDLITIDKHDACNPYITLKILTNDGSREVYKKKTPTAKNTVCPIFDNTFNIDINSSDLINHKMVIAVKDDTNYGAFASKPILGMLTIRLDSLSNRQLSKRWIPLTVENK